MWAVMEVEVALEVAVEMEGISMMSVFNSELSVSLKGCCLLICLLTCASTISASHTYSMNEREAAAAGLQLSGSLWRQSNHASAAVDQYTTYQKGNMK